MLKRKKKTARLMLLPVALTLLVALSVSCTKTVTKIEYVSPDSCGALLQAKHDSLVIAKEIIEELVRSNEKLAEELLRRD